MSENFFLSILSMFSGLLVVGAGCFILYKTKVLRTTGPDGKEASEIEVPFFGKMKTNYPSLIAIFIGAVLIAYPLYRFPSVPEKMKISGNIIKDGQTSQEGIIVGIISQNCMTTTDSHGNYSLQVPKNETSYTGLAYFRQGKIKEVYLGMISIDMGTGEKKFNYVFGR